MKKIAVLILSALLLTSCVFEWKEAELESWNQGDIPEFSKLNVQYFGNLEFELSFRLFIENESSLDYVGAYLGDQFFSFEKDGDEYFAKFRSDQPYTINVVPCASVKGVLFQSTSYKVEVKN
ncbi:MAG: hypothetical protein IKI40_08585 [Treponema sp.]|nr:hypothetical protein [Treponema sp.]